MISDNIIYKISTISKDDFNFFINSLPTTVINNICNNKNDNNTSLFYEILKNDRYDLVELLIEKNIEYNDYDLYPLLSKYDKESFELFKKLYKNEDSLEFFKETIRQRNNIYSLYIFDNYLSKNRNINLNDIDSLLRHISNKNSFLFSKLYNNFHHINKSLFYTYLSNVDDIKSYIEILIKNGFHLNSFKNFIDNDPKASVRSKKSLLYLVTIGIIDNEKTFNKLVSKDIKYKYYEINPFASNIDGPLSENRLSWDIYQVKDNYIKCLNEYKNFIQTIKKELNNDNINEAMKFEYLKFLKNSYNNYKDVVYKLDNLYIIEKDSINDNIDIDKDF